MPKENRATGNMQKKMVKIARVVPEISSRTDGETDTQTDILITILRNRSAGEVMTPAYVHAPDTVKSSGIKRSTAVQG